MKWHIYALSLPILLLLFPGCSSSNLHKRPKWAKEGTLPKDLQKKYGEDKYEVKVVSGTGPTLQAAIENCEANAHKEFAETISSRVTSIYQKKAQLVSSHYQKTYKKNVNTFVQVVAKEVFTNSLKKVRQWDGYEGDLKYVFACYVLDKEKAGEVVQSKAIETYKGLQEKKQKLLSSQENQEETATDALKLIMELEILQEQAIYFQKEIPIFKDAQKLRTQCLDIIYKGIRRRIEMGNETEKEKALEFAEKTLEYYPSGVVKSAILTLKRMLPCTECGRKGYCIVCEGRKGEWKTCPRCNGTGKEDIDCRRCNGTKKEICSRCNGTGLESKPCNKCTTGYLTCPTCKGKGFVVGQCNRCHGYGHLQCGDCGGSGTITDPTGRPIPCPTCKGKGKFLCSACQGSGRLRYKCEASALEHIAALLGDSTAKYKYCDGTGKVSCDRCGGDKIMEVPCSLCRGEGRYGICKLCRGTGINTISCRRCPARKKGFIFVECKHCKGTGKCPVCKGKGHRV
ncbi:MAG: hypothetical protein D6805_03750 [Planctomycetota bacterium]|nr:MAG: hypothetical protein D6805_03750 [Planctomycetota bacterium]